MKENFFYRAYILCSILLCAAAVPFLGFMAYGASVKAWERVVHFRIDVWGYSISEQLLGFAGYIIVFVAITSSCALCLEGAISLLRFYIKFLKEEEKEDMEKVGE